MDAVDRIEQALAVAVAHGESADCPPRLAAAIRYAVFPGGARIRPRLCLAVAEACGAEDRAVADSAAASIELLHCASLIHDDLPCFDNAERRRGRSSVHRAFGERIAVLAGDALIVMAFETLARGAASAPERLVPLILTIGRSAGVPSGISAGQAWECEPNVPLARYHREKTGALFAAATVAGAAAGGADPGPWHNLGERLGEAYQVADDIRDVSSDPEELGKPTGRDAALGRPSAAGELGVEGAILRLEELVASAIEAIPACPGGQGLRQHILAQARSLLPKKLARRAA